MSDHPQQPASRTEGRGSVAILSPPGRQTVLWLMTILLAVIATALVMRRPGHDFMSAAFAQSELAGLRSAAGGRGIYAFSGQLTSKSYGVWMLDVDTGTIWCYELSRGANDELQMRLVASRSWIFDRYLEEFNVAEPIPAAVRAMVQQYRSRQAAPEGEVPDASGGSAPAQPDDSGDNGNG